MPANKPSENEQLSKLTSSLLVSHFVLGFVRAFPRYIVVVGFVLFFLPQHVPPDAHIAWLYLAWGVYLLTPVILWKLFDRLDAKINDMFNRAKQKSK